MNHQLISNMVLISNQFNIFLKMSIFHQTTKQFNSLSNISNRSKTKYHLRISKNIHNSSSITQLILRKFSCHSNNTNKSLNWNHLLSRVSNKYSAHLYIPIIRTNNSTLKKHKLSHNKNSQYRRTRLGNNILYLTQGVLRTINQIFSKII